MINIKSIANLVSFVLKNEGNEWIYVNLEEWENNPRQSTFWLIEEEFVDGLADDEVYESEAGPLLPISIKQLNLWPWMTQDIFLGVLQNIKVSEVSEENTDFVIKAINHYRQFDDFLDV